MRVHCKILSDMIGERSCVAEQKHFRRAFSNGIPKTSARKAASCYNCDVETRRCIHCFENKISDAARGLCGACLFAVEGLGLARKKLIARIEAMTVFCQAANRSILGSTCLEMQGAKYCGGCAAVSRLCEKCHVHAVAAPNSGLCGKCDDTRRQSGRCRMPIFSSLRQSKD